MHYLATNGTSVINNKCIAFLIIVTCRFEVMYKMLANEHTRTVTKPHSRNYPHDNIANALFSVKRAPGATSNTHTHEILAIERKKIEFKMSM